MLADRARRVVADEFKDQHRREAAADTLETGRRRSKQSERIPSVRQSKRAEQRGKERVHRDVQKGQRARENAA